MAGFRVILAVACVAVLAGTAFSYKRCGYASWGRKNDNINVQNKPDIGVGVNNAVVDVTRQVLGCSVVGVEAIACDWYEEPVVSFKDRSYAVVSRNYAADPASFRVITYCEPVTLGFMGIGVPVHMPVKK